MYLFRADIAPNHQKLLEWQNHGPLLLIHLTFMDTMGMIFISLIYFEMKSCSTARIDVILMRHNLHIQSVPQNRRLCHESRVVPGVSHNSRSKLYVVTRDQTRTKPWYPVDARGTFDAAITYPAKSIKEYELQPACTSIRKANCSEDWWNSTITGNAKWFNANWCNDLMWTYISMWHSYSEHGNCE